MKFTFYLQLLELKQTLCMAALISVILG